MPIRGVGRAAKRCCSLPLADARGLPDAMEHCSKRGATRRAAPRREARAFDRLDRTIGRSHLQPISLAFATKVRRISRCRSISSTVREKSLFSRDNLTNVAKTNARSLLNVFISYGFVYCIVYIFYIFYWEL